MRSVESPPARPAAPQTPTSDIEQWPTDEQSPVTALDHMIDDDKHSQWVTDMLGTASSTFVAGPVGGFDPNKLDLCDVDDFFSSSEHLSDQHSDDTADRQSAGDPPSSGGPVSGYVSGSSDFASIPPRRWSDQSISASILPRMRSSSFTQYFAEPGLSDDPLRSPTSDPGIALWSQMPHSAPVLPVIDREQFQALLGQDARAYAWQQRLDAKGRPLQSATMPAMRSSPHNFAPASAIFSTGSLNHHPYAAASSAPRHATAGRSATAPQSPARGRRARTRVNTTMYISTSIDFNESLKRLVIANARSSAPVPIPSDPVTTPTPLPRQVPVQPSLSSTPSANTTPSSKPSELSNQHRSINSTTNANSH